MWRAEALEGGAVETFARTELVHSFQCAAALLEAGPEVRYVACNRAFMAALGLSETQHPVTIESMEPTFSVAEAVTHAISTRTNDRLRLPPFGNHTRDYAVCPLESRDGVTQVLLIETLPNPPLTSTPHQAQVLDQLSPLGGGFIYVYDVALKRTVYANEHLLSLMGLSTGGSVALEGFLGRVHPDDVCRFAEHVVSFEDLNDHDVARLEFQMKNEEGSWRWIDNHVRVCRRKRNGKVRRVV